MPQNLLKQRVMVKDKFYWEGICPYIVITQQLIYKGMNIPPQWASGTNLPLSHSGYLGLTRSIVGVDKSLLLHSGCMVE